MQKLELTWIGKDETINPEPRILLEKPEHAYGDSAADNMLIHGDNLLALKALESEFAGEVKCIYIDPPYNTGAAFEHYDDNLEHSTWLNLMKPRLELLRRLLKNEGLLWISISDDEQAYLKVLCDEIFGRSNFIANIIWNSTKSVTNTALISVAHTHTLLYAKNKEWWIKNRTEFRLPESGEGFSNPDNDPRGEWKADPFQVGGWRPNQQYEITNPNTGKVYKPNKDCSWKNDYEKFQELIKDNRIVFGKDGTAGPQRKRFLSEALDRGKVATTIWNDVDTTTNGTQHSKKLFGNNPFTNPKPEGFIERILELSTNPNDLVLDSFLGSGTTAAVAHKMGRRYIGIELGDHAYTHCLPRLKAVVDGEQGGISKAVNWKGGGGFKVYELAPTLLEKDEYGVLEISGKYNEEMLAAAMAKHEGYTYAPVTDPFWKQGYSGEHNFIFTTTGYISPKYLDNIATQLGADEYLFICAESFDMACVGRHKNITVRPIPRMLLGRCEWGKDNYDLNVIMEEVTQWEDDE